MRPLSIVKVDCTNCVLCYFAQGAIVNVAHGRSKRRLRRRRPVILTLFNPKAKKKCIIHIITHGS
jgi:hypothetical protein